MDKTYEKQASVKNGVSRMVFAVISILAEVLVILLLPVTGALLYLLIGLNGHSLKMRKRYEDIDRILLPMLPGNEEVAEKAKARDLRLGGIIEYIRRQAGYPVYQNTEVRYYDDGVKGFEAQKADLAKAEKFIFMEYHAFSLAARRGVDVRIITPGIPDKKIVYSVTRSYYNGLCRNGVRIFEYTPGFCHAKMSVADDLMATCGTINLDYRSLYHHFENGCLYADCDAVMETKKDFEETFAQCSEVTEYYTNGRGAFLRFGQMLLRLAAPLM